MGSPQLIVRLAEPNMQFDGSMLLVIDRAINAAQFYTSQQDENKAVQ